MMTKRVVYVVVPVLVMALALVGLAEIVPLAQAAEQAAAPPAPPPRQDSTANWSIGDQAFESNYPEGFTFQVQASSSAGEIVSARLKWYRPTLRPSQVLSVYNAEVTHDPTSGEFSATWQPDATKMVPPWAPIKYHWEFRDAAGNEYQTEPVLAEYVDDTRAWERSESEDAIVFTSDLEGDINAMVLEAMAL